ncbi:Fc.00g012130.m01.CDS01 [Cosmosporella sp. VM-42]
MHSLRRTESESSAVSLGESGSSPDPPNAEAPDGDDPSADIPISSRPYVYEPLEAGSLRLLFLLEADNYDDDLECAILHVPLKDDTEYTALSYVWGTERNTHKIFVGDKYLTIGANLDSALRQLRRTDHLLCLWVDALCINQGDVKERNHQVHQMRCIYESAKNTIVYLGDQTGDNTGFSAWNFLERNSSWALNDDKEKDHERPAILEDQLAFRGDLHDVYHDVLSREWFSRVWVFQEVVVSKDVSIQCGPRRISWDDFCKLAILQNRTHDFYGLSLQQEDLFEAVRRIWQARVAFHVSKGQSSCLPSWYEQVSNLADSTTDILGMLVRARNLKASDPRDKIFALLGISTGFDWEGLDTIDYARTTSYVYTTFAGDLMTTRNDYKLLSYLNSESTIERLNQRIDGWSAERERYLAALERAHTVESQRLLRAQVDNLSSNAVLDARLRQAESDEAFASVLFEECNSQEEHLDYEIHRCAGTQRLKLPSWVPNWQCIHLTTYEPRAIIEAAQLRHNLLLQVENYRTWLSSGVLAIHGRVIGSLGKTISSASLLGKDETTFEDLKNKWQQSSTYQKYRIEAQILTMWAHFLDSTAWTAKDELLRSQVNMISLSPELRRRNDYDVNIVLGNPPGSGYPGLSKTPSFLDFLDLRTWPPTPGSIEAHLVDRARKTAKWSDESHPAMKVVNDRNSIIDQRLIGVYTSIDGDDQHFGDGSGAPDSGTGPQSRNAHPVLLPSSARFSDLVAYFPGAEVPFIIRPRMTCPIMDSSVEEMLTCGSLPFLDCTELYTECELIGECWINNLDTIIREDKKPDHVFGIV